MQEQCLLLMNSLEKKNNMSNIKENWNKPNGDEIDVPDELMPLFNKIGMQIKFLTISGKNEILTIADILEGTRKFFSENKHLLE